MKVLYIAARYHTNQIPIMAGWKEQGDSVMFISQYAGGTEDYSVLKPVILGYSILFLPFLAVYRFYCKILKKDITGNYNFQAKFGIIPIFKFIKIIKKYRPEVTILRDRSTYNIGAYFICTYFQCKCILYNQTPLYVTDIKKGFFHRAFCKFMPEKRITPVLGEDIKGSHRDKNAYYVPFVITPKKNEIEKKHFINDNINIICVGKFEERKHHIMLLDVLNSLRNQEKLHLTLIGECKTSKQEEYLSKVKSHIEDLHLRDMVTVKQNISLEDIFQEYNQSDLFVLPSTGEFASISQLEAMSCSLPVICSNTNGTSCYIEEALNGYIFQDNKRESLEEKVKLAISDRNLLVKMGNKSYQLVQDKYCFQLYKKEIQKIIRGI